MALSRCRSFVTWENRERRRNDNINSNNNKYLTTNDDEEKCELIWNECGELQIHTDIYHSIWSYSYAMCKWLLSNIPYFIHTRDVKWRICFLMIAIQIVWMITSLENVMTRLQFSRFIILIALWAFSLSVFLFLRIMNMQSVAK